MRLKSFLLSGLGVLGVIAVLALVLSGGKASVAAVEIGQPAKNFTAKDSNGQSVTLDSFKGQRIVLEWTNDGCPFVQKHYNSGNMQRIQNKYKDNTVWLSIISSAPGKQGHVTGEGANTLTTSRQANPDLVILDESGEVGKLYEAVTTPHMFVIDENFNVVYDGAIDNNNSTNPATIKDATNYVEAALDALAKGEAIETPKTRPYGCSVKY